MDTVTKFDELEMMNPMTYTLSDLLRIAGDDALVHRLVTMAYGAGTRDASNVVLSKLEEAVKIIGYNVVDASLRMGG